MRVRLLWFACVVFLLAGIWAQFHKQPTPVWTGSQWSCPAGYTVTAGESDMLAGKPFVACSK